jgi:deoxyguanosine kinase
MAKEIYLSLGSNLGNRVKHLEDAYGHLLEQVGAPGRMSRIYESEPWGFSSDHRFCNCCISVFTTLEPLQVLETVLRIEKEMGRQRNTPGIRREGYADRTIDIDLLLFGNLQVHHPRLVLPHPALADRRFVLLPLYDIAPQIVHPVLGMTVEQMLQLCTDEGKVWPFGQPGK